MLNLYGYRLISCNQNSSAGPWWCILDMSCAAAGWSGWFCVCLLGEGSLAGLPVTMIVHLLPSVHLGAVRFVKEVVVSLSWHSITPRTSTIYRSADLQVFIYNGKSNITSTFSAARARPALLYNLHTEIFSLGRMAGNSPIVVCRHKFFPLPVSCLAFRTLILQIWVLAC